MSRQKITLEQLDRLSVDTQSGQLFWDNMEVITVLSLPWWVQWSALLIAALSLIWSVAKFFIARKWPPPK